MKNSELSGHITAILTVCVWATTYISTKVLLTDLTPVEILFIRFTVGMLILFIIYPHRLKLTDKRQELTFAAAGLCGLCLYYLLENIALTYTMVSNIGVIVSANPFFTAILSQIFLKNERKLTANFFVGFAFAMTGIALISFNGARLQVNPLGDFLALLSAFIWAVYSLLTRKTSTFGYNTIQATRRTFVYGTLFILPALILGGFNVDFATLTKPVNLLNLLYLSVCASAICFVSWNFAVKVLGAVRTSVYIYLGPVVTVVSSALILGEKITLTAAAGTGLTLMGLFISGRQK